MKTVTATELQRNTRGVMDHARTKGEAVVVESHGKPMVALLPFEEYERYLRYKEQRRALFERLDAFAAANAASNRMTEEEALALAEQVRQEVWEETHR